ncbi:hypothetical protein CQY20_22035 [Mycolicibacterium agri]|uniref:Uncharacterized protein n=1 Tax=Mycolicibacterium agri TaxID=36811 RepID=A0A2A7MUI4_MYCAG|nr:hypothetical protein CQY20_22035 [Mycolicibacterium agri]
MLPVPPLRLRRLRLQGVGPDGARFDPLDLDFATAAGAASRVLLSLTNTGGKSTLITLISSVIVPASREQVGRKNLGDYVLTGDTAHVVCEWEDASTGVRTIAGTVMEWKEGRRQPGHKQRSTTNMHRAWYLFRTGPGLPGMDDLPFVSDSHRTVYAAFIDAVRELIAQYPEAQGVAPTTNQKDWEQTLQDRTSIDPELFRYQMRMNDSETGAEKLVSSFNSPDNVVRFFIAALNDDRDIADFTSKLAAYADLAADRPRLEALYGFSVEVAPRIEQIADRDQAVDATEATAIRANAAGSDLAGALKNRLNRDNADLVEQRAAVEKASEELGAARRDYGQVSDIRLQLQLEDARARVVVAKEHETQCVTEAERDGHEVAAWEAVDVVIDIAQRTAERDEAKLAYDNAQAGLEPLRDNVTAKAASLAGRLDALISQARVAAGAAEQRQIAAKAMLQQAIDAEKDADQRLQSARRELTDIANTVRTADEATAAAQATGWLTADESPTQCQRRWQDTRRSARQRAEQEHARAQEAERARSECDIQIGTVDTELVELRSVAQSHQRNFDDYTAGIDELSTLDAIGALLGGPARSNGDVTRARELAEQAARDADRRYHDHETIAREAREELAQLDQTGTAPTGIDTIAVLDALRAVGAGVVTGLDWIQRNVANPDVRAEFIRTHPDIGGGVIVSDAKRFDSAVEHLKQAPPRTRTPVTVTTPPSGINATTDSDDRSQYVVLPHRATWDQQWAEATRAELVDTANSEGAAASRARAAATAHREAAAMCAAFINRWDATSDDALQALVASATKAVEAAAERRRGLLADRDTHAATAREARATVITARDDAARADGHASEAGRLVTLAESAGAAEARRPAADDARRSAEHDAQIAAENREEASSTIASSAEDLARAKTDGDNWKKERSELAVDGARPDPGGNLEVLRAAWTAARDELSTAAAGIVEIELLRRAERVLGQAQRRRERVDPPTWARAETLASTTEASSPESLIAAQHRAQQVWQARERRRLQAEHQRRIAEDAVRKAQPASGHNYVDLSNIPEWKPATPQDIPELLVRLERRNVELLARRDTAEKAETDAIELRDAYEADVKTIGRLLTMWPYGATPTEDVYTGPVDDAGDRMGALLEARNKAEEAARLAREQLSEAVNTARAIANSATWRDLDEPVLTRIRLLRDDELVAEATLLGQRVRKAATAARGDLDEMDTHRTILRDGLVSLCREQRRLLREVSRSSQLPAGLGELTGQAAIKIRFDEAPDDVAASRLADRVDGWAVELADNPKRVASPEIRTRWLADAVRDTVVDRSRAGAWTVEILKPRIDGRVMYCPPERIPDEFSGGQVLTLAVLVYCALSRVRAAHRAGGARPPGTLLLDNPFGAASAEALIKMQHWLAAHTGLQLVCATGLNDANVDKAFCGPGSVIIKLRNDGDLRRNLSYLRLRDRVVDGVDVVEGLTSGRPVDAERNWVDATRYEVLQ